MTILEVTLNNTEKKKHTHKNYVKNVLAKNTTNSDKNNDIIIVRMATTTTTTPNICNNSNKTDNNKNENKNQRTPCIAPASERLSPRD